MSNLGGDEKGVAKGVRAISVALSVVLLILLAVPFSPSYPSVGLDTSWMYGLNEAVARHLRFGRDIIFTFGPYASVYTRQYHPSTDHLMIAGSIVVYTAGFALFARSSERTRQAWMWVLPFLVSQSWLQDAPLMVTPLVLLYAAEREEAKRDDIGTAILCFGSASCGLLLLVKGSFAPMVCGCVGLAAVLRWSAGSRKEALAIICALTVATIAAWVVAGQSLLDLPQFFRSQLPIISGYTEAMALPGNNWEPALYCGCAAALLFLCVTSNKGKSRVILTIGLALFLFMSFKAGFVRHDGHAAIAASALAMAGLLAFYTTPGTRGLVALVLSEVVFFSLISSYQPMDLWSISSRSIERLGAGLHGAAMRWRHAATLEHEFENAKSLIGSNSPIEHSSEKVDVYPTELSYALAASIPNWWPRPIFQSYSAYTGELLDENVQHLISSPPDEIFFDVRPIDGRYPASDDSKSWPVILSNYEPISTRSGFIQFRRRKEPIKIEFSDQIRMAPVAFGEPQKLSPFKAGAPVWARIEMEPNWLGRLVALAYKVPPVSMHLMFGSHRATYRLIPSISKFGFLLSPTVQTIEDFLALLSPESADLALGGDRIPMTLTVDPGAGGRWFWKGYSLSLSQMKIPGEPEVDRLIFSPSRIEPVSFNLPPGGTCVIDSINELQLGSQPAVLKSPVWKVRGWALLSVDGYVTNNGVKLMLTDSSGSSRIYETRVVTRPDVGRHFKHEEASNVGYEALIDARALRGPRSTIRIIQKSVKGDLLCDKTAVVMH